MKSKSLVILLSDNQVETQRIESVLVEEEFQVLSATLSNLLVLLQEHEPLIVVLDLDLLGQQAPALIGKIYKATAPEGIILGYGSNTNEPLMDETFHAGLSVLLRTPLSSTELRWTMRNLKLKTQAIENVTQLLGQAREKDMQTDSLLKSIFTSTPEVVIFAIDTQFRYLAFNPLHAEHMKLVFNVDIAEGMDSLQAIRDPAFLQAILPSCNEAMKGTSSHTVIKIPPTTRSPQHSFYDFHISPIINGSGSILGISLFGIDITEDQNKSQELKDSIDEAIINLSEKEQTLNLIIENSMDLKVLLNSAEDIQFASPSWGRQMHVKPEKLLGTPLNEWIYPKDRPLFQKWLKAPLHPLQIRIVPHRGNPLWVEARGKHLVTPKEENLTYVTFRDIQLLKDSSARLKTWNDILDQNPQPLELLDTRGKIVYINQSYVDTFGYSSYELQGRISPLFSLADEESPHLHQTLAMAKNQGSVNTVLSFRLKEGGIIPDRIHLFPLRNEKGMISNFVCFHMNITEEYRQAEEIKQKENLLILQTRQAQMGSLLNVIAHQWRQPLSRISLNLANIQLKLDTETLNLPYLQGKLGLLSATVTYLSETIESFRTYYSPSKEKQTTDLWQLVYRALDLVLPTIHEAKIEIQTEPPLEPIYLSIYPGEMIQVVVELLNNAREAITTSQIEPKILRIDLRHGLKDYVLQISNSGEPIPLSIVEHLFDPYFTTKNQQHGTGLGLYMARNIITEHHGGSIHYQTTQLGPSFIVRLPHSTKETL